MENKLFTDYDRGGMRCTPGFVFEHMRKYLPEISSLRERMFTAVARALRTMQYFRNFKYLLTYF